MLLKAVEEKRFFPLGSDKETQSDFQLIAGTNRDLREDVGQPAAGASLFKSSQCCRAAYDAVEKALWPGDRCDA
jgi:sigma54-dependent transcription regulator